MADRWRRCAEIAKRQSSRGNRHEVPFRLPFKNSIVRHGYPGGFPGDGTVGARTRRSSRRLAMPHPRDFRDVYRRQAEACLAVLTTTTNPTSQAMLTAMAHTWMRLADSRLITDGGNAEQYRRNAYEACQSMTNAEPQDQALWLPLACCWP